MRKLLVNSSAHFASVGKPNTHRRVEIIIDEEVRLRIRNQYPQFQMYMKYLGILPTYKYMYKVHVSD